MKHAFTRPEILAAAKSVGFRDTRAAATVNGSVVYHVADRPGLWTLREIARLAGLSE